MSQTSSYLDTLVRYIANKLYEKNAYELLETMSEGEVILHNSKKYTIVLEKHPWPEFNSSKLNFHGKKYCLIAELFSGLMTRGIKTYEVPGILTCKIELFISTETPTIIETFPGTRTLSIFTNELV